MKKSNLLIVSLIVVAVAGKIVLSLSTSGMSEPLRGIFSGAAKNENLAQLYTYPNPWWNIMPLPITPTVVAPVSRFSNSINKVNMTACDNHDTSGKIVPRPRCVGSVLACLKPNNNKNYNSRNYWCCDDGKDSCGPGTSFQNPQPNPQPNDQRTKQTLNEPNGLLDRLCNLTEARFKFCYSFRS